VPLYRRSRRSASLAQARARASCAPARGVARERNATCADFPWPALLISAQRGRAAADQLRVVQASGFARASAFRAIDGGRPAELRAASGGGGGGGGGFDFAHLRCAQWRALAAKRVAIWVSHMAALRRAAAAAEPTLVLEEDVRAAEPAESARWAGCLAEGLRARADWDLVFLGSCLEQLGRVRACACVDGCDALGVRTLWLARAFQPACTHAILYTARGAQRVLDSPRMRGWAAAYWNASWHVSAGAAGEGEGGAAAERGAAAACAWQSKSQRLRLPKDSWFRRLNMGHDQVLRSLVGARALRALETWPPILVQAVSNRSVALAHRTPFNYGHSVPKACVSEHEYAAIKLERLGLRRLRAADAPA
jgi:hypothetical protein